MIKGLVIDWLVNTVIAYITRWLDQNTPTQGKHDAKPTPIIKPKTVVRRRPLPNSTAPGTWNRIEGRWNE
jgi:hypothetical protein